MPPVRPEYTWRETNTTVTVDVKITGASRKNCDVFLSDYFLKVWIVEATATSGRSSIENDLTSLLPGQCSAVPSLR